MLEIGLTGCRYSGKTSVSKLFRKIGVPVFDSDTVLKFILNFRTHVDEPIRSNVGSFVYNSGFLDPSAFITDSLFDRTIDVVEFELLQAWDKFKEKHKDKPYVIFESSILFERKWDQKFDRVISVFAPKEERVYRAKMDSSMRIDYIWSSFDKEISELEKNSNSNYIIHNYDGGPDVLDQVNGIDTKITNIHLDNKIVKKKQLTKNVFIFQ